MISRVSFLPLDVGFDLRAHDMPINLPEGAQEVIYLNQAGEEEIASGSRDEIARQLMQAGFKVVV